MEYSKFLLWKAGLLLALAFLVNFFHALFTGRTLEAARSDTQPDLQTPADRAS